MKYETGPMASGLLAIETVVLVAVVMTACLPIAGAFAFSGASLCHRPRPHPMGRRCPNGRAGPTGLARLMQTIALLSDLLVGASPRPLLSRGLHLWLSGFLPAPIQRLAT